MSTTALVCIFCSILNSIMKGWKYRSRKLLKAIFCQEETIREQTSSVLNFLQPSVRVCRGAYISYFKINTSIFCCFIFFEECPNPQFRINKMVNEHTADNHPNLWLLQNISQTCISHHGCKKGSNSWYKDYWKIHLWVKLNLFTPKQNSPPGFYHHQSRQKEIIHFLQTKCFENLFSPAERGRTIELKIWPKLNLQGYWSQVLINSIPPFATFTFLVSVLLCHNLRFKQAEVWRFFNLTSFFFIKK